MSTRWEANYEGHKLVVSRNEVTKGFDLEWDGTVIAKRTWSWIGLGELHATADVNGEPREVQVAIEWGGLKDLNGECTIRVGDDHVPATRVK